MSTTTNSPITNPLLIEQVSNSHPGMFVEPGPGLSAVFGYHSSWCISDVNEPGVSVEDHGRWCEAASGSTYEARWGDGSEGSVFVCPVEQYVHGVIRTEDFRRLGRGGNSQVRLIFNGDDENEWLFISPSAARSLAAILIRAADTIELR